MKQIPLQFRYAGMAQSMWDALSTFGRFEEDLDDLIAGEFESLGHDYYDGSLTINDCDNDVRLDEKTQQFIKDAGFYQIYVRHKDGWETHYNIESVVPIKGWRRRYISNPEANTGRGTTDNPNPGYYEISYWPDSWGDASKEWLTTGYMRIVPDPLEQDYPKAVYKTKGS